MEKLSFAITTNTFSTFCYSIFICSLYGGAIGAAFGRIAGEPGFTICGVLGACFGAIKGFKRAYYMVDKKNSHDHFIPMIFVFSMVLIFFT